MAVAKKVVKKVAAKKAPKAAPSDLPADNVDTRSLTKKERMAARHGFAK